MHALITGNLPVLTDNPTLVALADWARRGVLLIGLVIAAVAAHDLAAGLPPVRGIRLRVGLIVVGSLYVCLTAYANVGRPVTPQLPVGIGYQILALLAIRMSASHDSAPSESERRLRGEP